MDEVVLENKLKVAKSGTRIIKAYKIPEHLLLKYADKLCWVTISTYQILSESFIKNNLDKLYINLVVVNNEISESFIDDNIDVLYSNNPFWSNLVKIQTLSESFLERYSDKIDWLDVVDKQVLSCQFLVKHINKMNDYYINALRYNTKINQEDVEPFYVMWELSK
jgi:hypothetical protein